MAKKCECERDSDGHCSACRMKIHEVIRGFSEAMERFKKEMKELGQSFEEGCRSCGAEYLDVAAAGIIVSTPYKSLEDLAEGVGRMKNMGRAAGVKVMPLLDRAAEKLIKEKGWAPSEVQIVTGKPAGVVRVVPGVAPMQGKGDYYIPICNSCKKPVRDWGPSLIKCKDCR